ncbi:MAG: amino acid-binding protein [Acidobacteria bacterium]|nr:amino acid-binding protein [Acidobacteriota bacterium]
MAHVATDLAVTLPEDRPGMLSRAVNAVSNAGINLEGHAEMEGVVHILTTDAAAARDALEEAGFRVVKEQQVVLVPVEDRPGSAASVFRRIADAKVNIRFSYLATRNRLVIAADDLGDLIDALKE